MIRALVVAGAFAALALAGCGGDDEDEAEIPGPAAAVPAESVYYAETVVRPEGDARESLEDSLGILLGTDDPAGEIVDRFNSLSADDVGFVYQTDIEPWLGERAAMFFTAPTENEGEAEAGENALPLGGANGASLFDVTDTDAAQEAVEKLAAWDEEDGDPVEDASYEGTSYKVDEIGIAFGVVGDHLAFGTEQGFKDLVDVEGGADALSDDDEYGATAGAAEGEEGALYVDVPALIDSAEATGELDEPAREAVEVTLGDAVEEPLTGVWNAESGGFALELSYGATDAPLLAMVGETPLLGDLPADSWLAAGVPGAGAAISSLLESAESIGVAPAELDALREEFRRAYGLELEEFYEPLGDAALFAAGQGIFGVGGGLVFEVDDDDAGRLLTGLRRAAERAGEDVEPLSGDGAEGFAIPAGGTPGTINFVVRGDRLVVAYGDQATRSALEPEETLAGSEGLEAAEAALGDEYDLTGYLDLAPLAGLLDLASVTNPALEQALPIVKALDFVAAGTRADGDRTVVKMFIGVAEPDVEPSA